MQSVLNTLIFAALAAVVFVLFWGLWNMFRGGDGNLSQKLMRARVAFQFVAIMLLMAALYFFGPRP